MKKYQLLLMLALLIANTAFGKDVYKNLLADDDTTTCLGEAKVSCQKEVAFGENFRYEITLPCQSDDVVFKMPDVNDFELLAGPYTSNVSSYNVNNGNVKKTNSVTFSNVYIANKAGQCVIPSFNIALKNQNAYYIVPEQQVTVTKGAQAQMDEVKAREEGKMAVDSLFIEWTVAKKQAFVGDTIRCSCRLYTTKTVTQMSCVDRCYPENCLIDECEWPEAREYEKITRDGIDYQSVLWMEYIVTPTKSGEVTIGGDMFDAIILIPDVNADPFEAFFNGGSACNEVAIPVKSSQVTINVENRKDVDMISLGNKNEGAYLLLDISTSMYTSDFEPNRLGTVKKLARNVINEMPEVGLLAYAGDAERFFPSGHAENKEEMIEYLDTLKLPLVDGTAISDALVYPLLKSGDVKDVIVLCDGLDNLAHLSLNTALDILEKSNVRVNMLYFNSYKDSVVYCLPTDSTDFMVTMPNRPIPSDVIKTLTKKLKQTGGNFYTIRTDAKAETMLPEILRILRETRATEQKRPSLLPQTLLKGLRQRIL